MRNHQLGGIPNQQLTAKASENRAETQKEQIIFQLASIKFPRAKNGGITHFNQPLFEAFFSTERSFNPIVETEKIQLPTGFHLLEKGFVETND